MARLAYLSSGDTDELIHLTAAGFPGTPAFHLRGEEGEHLLLSAFAQPRWPYHRTLQRKAAALHYHLSQNHPFIDGNKRFALMAMAVFLRRNHALLLAGNDELLEYSLNVVSGAISRDASFEFIERRTIRLQWSNRAIERWAHRLSDADAEASAQALRYVLRYVRGSRPATFHAAEDALGVLLQLLQTRSRT